TRSRDAVGRASADRTAECGRPHAVRGRVHKSLVPVVIVVVIMIIVMAVAPVPVLFLVVLVQSAKVAVVTMIFDHPLTVVDSFVIVPAMIVVVIGIIDTIGSGCTASGHRWREECDGQEHRTETPGCTVHNVVPPGQCSFRLSRLWCDRRPSS